MARAGKNPAPLFLGVLIGLNILAWAAVYELSGQRFEVVFLDIGQGDATLIKTPQGHHILIDAGPSSAILEKLGSEMPFWKRSIDLIILTHPHHDHIAGFIDVLKRYKVENILWTGVLIDSAVFEEWEKLIEKEKADIYIARQGQTIEGGKVRLALLHPSESFENQKVEKIDNTSVVVKVVFGKKSFLFTGDAFQEVERELVRKGMSLESDVLQVGHHGSRTSSASEFIAAVLSEVAVISAGKNNPHGHPHQETLETLKNYDMTVLRTDVEGDIKVISDGSRLFVKFSKR